MGGRITMAGLQRAARDLDVELAAIRAVVDVESSGSGFVPDGRPKILFETHIFGRLTAGRYHATYPTLSTARPDRLLYQMPSYPRLYQAAQLDAEAALQSCSWGLFQIMGFNWKLCGEKSLHGFVLAQHHNEDAHLALFSRFVQQRDLAGALRRRDWADFARGYNGAGYAANAYDLKLAAAFARHSKGGE